jgi:hypothetical protein
MKLAYDTEAIHAYLTPIAKEAWGVLAEANGTSLTGILEAIGRELHKEIKDNDYEADGLRPEWVKPARKIDAERRRRKGTR